jgi:hypothetical protein
VTIPYQQPLSIGRAFIDLDSELIAAVLITVEAGWELARQNANVQAGAGEVTITECLRDGMRQALRQNKMWGWRKTMMVGPGTESRSEPHILTPDGRTDIPVFLWLVFESSGEHDPHAIIECKRLAQGNAYLTREYIINGVDRFCSGQYGSNHAHGFMVGYVIAGAPDLIVSAINQYLIDKARAAEQLNLSSYHNRAWLSRHNRNNASTIDVHHAMLLV